VNVSSFLGSLSQRAWLCAQEPRFRGLPQQMKRRRPGDRRVSSGPRCRLRLTTASIVVLGSIFLTGCGPPLSCLCRGNGEPLLVPAYSVATPPALPEPQTALAGVGRVDITPPPGYPTGGGGPEGGVARGYWTRLYARAFYFRDPDGHQLVMVSCDLFAMPAGLTAQVGSLVADLGISPEEMVLAATHTHQGPGNFLTARTFNDFGSPYSGFDVVLFRFLAYQIAQSIRTAVTNAREHAADNVELVLHQGQVSHRLLHNRAPQVFLLNWNHTQIENALEAGDPLPPGDCQPLCPDPKLACEVCDFWSYPGCPRLTAVDRSFKLLEIRRRRVGQVQSVGALLFLAAHPTVLPGATPLYSSDFTGLALRLLEGKWKSRDKDTDPVVGFFNGAEGDITARRPSRDVADAKTHALELADAVQKAANSPGTSLELQLDVRSDPGELSDPYHGAKCSSIGWPDVRLAATPQMGVAALGGGESDRTVLHQLGWSDGVRGEQHTFDVLGQAPKQPALDSPVLRCAQFTALLATRETFPQTLPLTLVRVGAPKGPFFEIATLPVEMTTAMAWDIARTIGFNRERTAFVGLANEYASYCVTPAEYGAQEYIGASTLWGQEEGPYLGCRLQLLRTASVKSPLTGGSKEPSRVVPLRSFDPGPGPDSPFQPFGPTFLAPRRRPDEELDRVLRDGQFVPVRNLPYFEWTEVIGKDIDPSEADSTKGVFPGDFLTTAERHVDIIDDNAAVVYGEDHADIITVLLEARPTK
jgi:neutral ceramidase